MHCKLHAYLCAVCNKTDKVVCVYDIEYVLVRYHRNGTSQALTIPLLFFEEGHCGEHAGG